MSPTAVRTIAISSIAIVGLCLGGAQHAECQTTRAKQMGPAVFGGTGTRADKPGGLDLFAQLFTSYDDNVLADQPSGVYGPRSVSAEGLYSGLSMMFQYARVGKAVDISAHSSNALNYYPDLDDLTTRYHQAGATLISRLGDRYTIRASPFAAYSPNYSMRLFLAPLPVDPDVAGSLQGPALAAPDVDSTILQRASFRYGGNAQLKVQAARHSTLTVGYGYTKTDLAGDRTTGDRRGNFDVQSVGATFSHRVSPLASLRLGYSLQESTFEGSTTPVTRTHNLDIGVDYRKPLSRSRRTYLSFSTGSVIAEQIEGLEQVEGRRIEATGSASLVHQMGRTWSTRAQYRREVGYLEGFARPVFSDSANFSVGGLLTRRTDVFVNANYITGTAGARRGQERFDSYSATARVRRALTRSLAAYVEYLFYHYDFNDVVDRPVNLPQEFSRNGVRVGLSLWLPLTN